MSSRKTAGRRGTTKKRAQRATSNVFAMFNQDQIQEFKEAFNMIDQNRDGFIDKEDLHDMLASLGKDPTDEYLEAMMNEAPGAHPEATSFVIDIIVEQCPEPYQGNQQRRL